MIQIEASGPQTLVQGLVRAIWTDDEALSTRISRHIAHYTGQEELAEVIQEGLEARKAGDEETASAKLGRVVALALVRERGHRQAARPCGRCDRSGDRNGAAQIQGRCGGRDGARYPVEQDRSGQEIAEEGSVVTCPDGHESAAADYCDVCGMRIGPPAALVTQREAGTGAGTGGPEAGAAPSRSAPPCPRCGSPGLERFCEACGYQVGSASAPTRIPAPSPDRPSAWTALVTASRPYFDAVMAARGPDSGSAQFPAYCPERRFQLTGHRCGSAARACRAASCRKST